MNTRLRAVLMLSLAALTVRCGGLWSPTPTPRPGWRSPVSELFVDESAFPEGWRGDFPEDTTMDPTVNHVAREWGRAGVSGTVTQAIWRAYTVAEAEAKYNEVYAESHFERGQPLNPGSIFIPFELPVEINFQSQVADEFRLACGWWDEAYCQVVARYRNYVVYMRLEREAACEGQVTRGLTYTEIEAVVRAMDAKFAEALDSFSTQPP